MLGAEPTVKPQIDSLVIIDRSVDLLSTLPTQLTYEGLIDELFGISQGSVKVPADRFSGGQQQSEPSGKILIYSFRLRKDIMKLWSFNLPF